MIEEIKKKSLKEILINIAIMLLVVSMGMFIINQVLEYRYRAEFLQAPCQLCQKLNKNQSDCIGNCFIKKIKLTPDMFGNWKDDTGNCFTSFGTPIECREEFLYSPPKL